MSKTDSRVSENDCKKTGQNKTVKWNNENWFIEAKKPIAHSSPEAGLHRSQSTAAAPIWHSHTSSEPFPDSKLQHHSSSRREINLNIPATNFRRRAKPSGRSGCVACARVRSRAPTTYSEVDDLKLNTAHTHNTISQTNNASHTFFCWQDIFRFQYVFYVFHAS